MARKVRADKVFAERASAKEKHKSLNATAVTRRRHLISPIEPTRWRFDEPLKMQCQ